MTFSTLLLILVALMGSVILLRLVRSGSSKKQQQGRRRTSSLRKTNRRVPAKQPKQKSKKNRYAKEKRREPSLGFNPLSRLDTPKPERRAEQDSQVVESDPLVQQQEADDSDTILGLKQTSLVTNHTQQNEPQQTKQHQQLDVNADFPEAIIIHLMAPKGRPYQGYDLLQALLSAGLRFGKANIFHRHETKTGHGEVLFSCASATKPGTFKLAQMGNISCEGVSLFVHIKNVTEPMKAMQLMLDTANQLLDDLGGKVLDEEWQPLVSETVVEWGHMLNHYQQLHGATTIN